MINQTDQLPLATIPVIDLQRWRDGDVSVAAEVDRALREVGFLMLTGHGVDPDLIEAARAVGYDFFHGPDDAKNAVSITDDAYRGWIGSGTESNAATYGVETLPDLKETYVIGAPTPAGLDPSGAAERWFLPNRWPAQPARFEATTTDYFASMAALANEVLELFAAALELDRDALTRACMRPTSSLDLNWYPSHEATPATSDDQFRVGPHTDFGTITLLHRQQGAGGLQVQLLDDSWIDAPWVPDAFTVNVGDLMSLWTNGRWRSTRHRVLPPPADLPQEELLSLVFFHGADHDALIEPFDVGTPGEPAAAPVISGEYVGAKIDALSAAHSDET